MQYPTRPIARNLVIVAQVFYFGELSAQPSLTFFVNQLSLFVLVNLPTKDGAVEKFDFLQHFICVLRHFLRDKLANI